MKKITTVLIIAAIWILATAFFSACYFNNGYVLGGGILTFFCLLATAAILEDN